MQRAIFLDKDGTLIPDIPFNVNPALIILNNDVGKGLKLLKKLGYLFIVISNQSGVALGYFKEEDLVQVNKKITTLLSDWNIEISGFYYCPHFEKAIDNEFGIKCNCRKPLPGLITKAVHDFNIDVKQSWMVGDILNDVEAGNRAGCRTILLNNGNETEWLKGDYRTPNFTTPSFMDAVEYIEKQLG